MIVGLGVDIAEVSRIEAAIARLQRSGALKPLNAERAALKRTPEASVPGYAEFVIAKLRGEVGRFDLSTALARVA